MPETSLQHTTAVKPKRQLTLAGRFPLSDAYATSFEIMDNTCYLSTSGGLTLLNITNPGEIDQLGSAKFNLIDEIGISICMMDNRHVYLGSNHALSLFNVSDKLKPKLIKRHSFSGHMENMVLHENRLYMTRNNYGFSIADMGSPTGLPVITGHFSGGNNAWIRGLFLHNKIAYVTKYVDNALLLLDISKPAFIKPLKCVVIPEAHDAVTPRLSSVVVENDHAYMAGGQNGLVIANVADPMNASVVSSILAKPVENGIVDVCVNGNIAYVADAESGIYVIDITNPAVPLLKEAITIKGGASRIKIVDNQLYCLNNLANDSKLLIYTLSE